MTALFLYTDFTGDDKKILDALWADEEADREASLVNYMLNEEQQAVDWKMIEGHVLHHKVVYRLNNIIDWYKAKCEEIFPHTTMHYEKLELKERKGTQHLLQNGKWVDVATYVYDIGAYLSSDKVFDFKLQLTINKDYRWELKEQEYYEERYSFEDEDLLFNSCCETTKEMFDLVREYFIDQVREVNSDKYWYEKTMNQKK
tara:strand:+ start:260 stop:862 length:603 start_codon:yes stop_codon:yes gene_type:complete